ncbi:hypothetical protein [Thalassoporum mexicanum]|nr:hypothetical protein [Pseudanabaena sp. PCC 7367]
MPATFAVLAKRSQYQSCHINTPDLDQPLAAIEFDQNFYSFFQTISSSAKALSMAAKLISRGDRLVVTNLSKGYGIWIYEPKAKLAKARKRSKQVKVAGACQMLTSREQYQARDIRVPDIDLPLPGLVTDGQNFSMFKMTTDASETLELVAKITQRGEQAAIVDFKNIFLVCVAEPDAQVLESVNVSRGFLQSESKVLSVAS